MSGKTQTVTWYTTKYWSTKGIEEVEGSLSEIIPGCSYFDVSVFRGTRPYRDMLLRPGRDVFPTVDEARKRLVQLADAKLVSLRAQQARIASIRKSAVAGDRG